MMECGSKENKGLGECIGGRDRLSELPDEVIVHILSFLPTLDAVRTMLLGRFGNLWTLVKTLKFKECCFDSDGNENDNKVLNSRFSLFVLNVLILHKRPTTIDKFLIRMLKDVCWDTADRAVAEVQAWIRFALSRETKALILDFCSRDFFPVHSSIMTSQSLVRLKLEFCSIQLPSRVHMGSLRTLELYYVKVDDASFNQFVSSCPSLYEVVVRNAEDLQVLNFSAPSIEKLEFFWDDEGQPFKPWKIDCPNLKILDISVYFDFVEVLKVPSAREVTINFAIFSPESDEDADQVRRCLEGFPNAEVLIFKYDIDWLLTYCAKANVAFPQNRWKRVVLDSSIQNTCVAGICRLVRNSPCLEELVINVYQHSIYLRGVNNSNLVSQEAASPCVAPHLKVVTMHEYAKRYEGTLRLAEFLLQSAVTLDKLVMFTKRGSELPSAKEVNFLKKISSFPRALGNAKIVFE